MNNGPINYRYWYLHLQSIFILHGPMICTWPYDYQTMEL
jgi:hypothetical protein